MGVVVYVIRPDHLLFLLGRDEALIWWTGGFFPWSGTASHQSSSTVHSKSISPGPLLAFDRHFIICFLCHLISMRHAAEDTAHLVLH